MYSECLNNLIISADDFGISEKANQKILELVKDKKIDRVSVMMGGKISKEEAKELLESGVKIDIHFHLLGPKYFSERTGEANNSTFKRIILFLLDYISGEFSAGRINIIWKNQIEAFREFFGKYPDGVNSHEHIHFFLPFFKTILKIKKEFNIFYIRLGKLKNPQRLGMIAWILDKLRRIIFRGNLIFFTPPGIARSYPFELNTSDFLVNFDWIKSKEEFFENLIENNQTELVFHPEQDEEYKFLKDNF